MRKRAVRTRQWKLIRALEADFHDLPPLQLFDLIADPREQRNLADERPDVVAELSARLEEWVARRRAETGKPDPVDLQRPTLHRIGEMKTAVPADPKLVVRQGGGVGDVPTNSSLQRRVEGEANPRDKVDGALDRKLYAEGGRAD
jgi:hypothetical protein